jgi:hypothetical protein
MANRPLNWWPKIPPAEKNYEVIAIRSAEDASI